ncbi:MAG: nucleotidyltransferase family protein [Lachnospiraceae bacterium]|nr:nucleotidyltransferase family protein [Lachnospiraceae bacterium]
MSQVLFEGRLLVNMISTLLRKGALQVRYGRVNWERMFRTADYHRVANIVYLGLLGNGDLIPERWMGRFFERYQEALINGGSCEAAEQEILALLDMEKIPCVVLTSATIRGLYELPETADMSPLRLYLSTENYTLLKGFLVDLGYETIQSYGDFGERMHRISGMNVDIYQRLPFKTKYYEKGMRELTFRARVRNGGTSVRILYPEDRMVFRMASVAYQYVNDEIMLRDMLDLFLYHRVWREQLNHDYVKKKLQGFHVDALADRLLRLSYMWFGEKEDKEYMYAAGEQMEDLSSFDILENRIFSRGELGKEKETDPQVLGLARLLEKEEEKETREARRETRRQRKEEKKKARGRSLRWIFPDYKYMSGLYPTLEKAPFLLPFYWISRGVRLLFGMMKNKDQ